MSLTWTFTGGAPEPHNELAGQTMIILCPRGLEPLAYILHSSADTWLDLPTQAVEP